MWLTVVGISYFWFLGALFQLTSSCWGQETLHVSDTHTGLLVTALALGIGLGSMAAGWLSGDRIEIGLVPRGRRADGRVLHHGGLRAHRIERALAGWRVGFSGGLFIVPLNAYLQERAGANEKGRLLATNNFVNMVGVIAGVRYAVPAARQLHWTPRSHSDRARRADAGSTVYIAWLVPAPLVRFLAGLLRKSCSAFEWWARKTFRKPAARCWFRITYRTRTRF